MIEPQAGQLVGNIVDNAYNPSTYGYGQEDFTPTMFGGEAGTQGQAQQPMFTSVSKCPHCDGSGVEGEGHTCNKCNGTGVVVEEKPVEGDGSNIADMEPGEKKATAIANAGDLQKKLFNKGSLSAGLWSMQDKLLGNAPGTYLSQHMRQPQE